MTEIASSPTSELAYCAFIVQWLPGSHGFVALGSAAIACSAVANKAFVLLSML